MSEPLNAKLYIAVGVGGMIGACGRYGISIVFHHSSGFPYATFTANLVGCFLLSFLLYQAHLKRMLPPEIYTALGTGMIGSFTTFSTFAFETVELWYTNHILSVSYATGSIVGGLACSFLGMTAARKRGKS